MHDSISHNLGPSRKLITDVKSALHKKELTFISWNTQPPPPFLYGQSDQWIPHFDSCQLTTTWMCNIRMHAITLYLFTYQLFWTQACPEGMWTNGTQVPCKVPSLPNPTTRKGWPHHQGLRRLLFLNSDVGSFTSHNNKSVKVLWDGTYGFSSLSEKTTKSNHLQMSLQRQHFLPGYLKTLSVGPVGVWTCDLPLGRRALSRLN